MKLTIVTINYNDKTGLLKTFNSIFNQSNSEFEYIVIDGGSTDGSVDLIKENSNKINFFISEKDNGVYNAYNKGVYNAKGEYILFVNSGDELYNNEVVKNVIFQLSGEDLIYGDLFVHRNETDKFIKYYPSKLKQSDFMFDSLPTPATFIKKNLFERIGYFDENFKIVSDWKFFMKAILISNATYLKINEVVAIFYYGGLSTNGGNYTERNIVLNDLFPFSVEDYYELKEKTYYYYSNRVKLLRNIEENSKFGTKIIYFLLIITNKLFGKKSIK